MSNETVIVASKLPWSIEYTIDKELFEFKGLNSLMNQAIPTPIPIDVYAFTTVPKYVWEAFSNAMADQEFIKKGMIFAQTSIKNAKSESKERSKIKTGLEGLDPDNPGKTIRGIEKGKLKE